MKKNRFPKGWDEGRVRSVVNYHESQTEEQEAAEIAAMFSKRSEALMAVPRKLVPQVRKLIIAHQAKFRSKSGKASAGDGPHSARAVASSLKGTGLARDA